MRLMDEQYIKTPYYGVGQMTYFLRNKGYKVNSKRVRRLLRLVATCPGPHTSKPGKGATHQVFPYLLRGMRIVKYFPKIVYLENYSFWEKWGLF